VGYSTAYPGLEAPSDEIVIDEESVPGKGFFPLTPFNDTTKGEFDFVCDENGSPSCKMRNWQCLLL
jgi:hypothetical protein